MQIELLRLEHLQRIELQEAQALCKSEIVEPAYFKAISASGRAYALVHKDVVLGCYGIQDVWQERAVAWSLLSNLSQRYMLIFHRIAKGFLAQLPMRRVEAYVVSGFVQGERWVEMLGFSYEGSMRAFFPNGTDAKLYARVRAR